MFSTLRYEIDEAGIGVMTFATPARLNAITEARLSEMEAVLEAAVHDPALRALILTGEGDRAFCVGLDLDLLDRAFADLGYFQSIVTRVAGVIARLEGPPGSRSCRHKRRHASRRVRVRARLRFHYRGR